jgi:hypothetical protein
VTDLSHVKSCALFARFIAPSGLGNGVDRVSPSAAAAGDGAAESPLVRACRGGRARRPVSELAAAGGDGGDAGVMDCGELVRLRRIDGIAL